MARGPRGQTPHMDLPWRREERLLRRLVGTGSRRGASPASRVGDILRQPLVWAGLATTIAVTGPRGRRAALRGATCSAVANLIHLPLKRMIGRPRPWGAQLIARRRLGRAFPSGHTASDLSFVLGASQELPVLLIPLSAATLASHWSLIRARKHYPSDVLSGGAIAVAVTAAAWRWRPPRAARAIRA
jgi:membrane-associated phospholipid phosphatase